MQNRYFNIEFNEKTGGITSIVNPSDEHNMNWCLAKDDTEWGLVHTYNHYFTWEDGRHEHWDGLVLESFNQDENCATGVYSNGMLRVTADHFFRDDGNFVERYTIENLRNTDVFIGQDNFGISVPFNDAYTTSADCMIHRCNTHLWCGHDTTYVNALRMGQSDINLGLVLTEGAIDSYSIGNVQDNGRGEFVLNSAFFTLIPGDKYVIEFELFWHTGNEDFYNKISKYPKMILVKAVNHTVFEGEPIEFYADCSANADNVSIICNDEPVAFDCDGDRINVKYQPKKTGEHRFDIKIGDVSTYTEFLVVKPLEEIIENRLNFIIDKQQYINEKSQLHGAFLIYDTKEKHPVFDDAFGDHNACRERVGMSLLLVKYLQTHDNPKFKKALDLYIEFVKREFYEETTGDVFGTVGKLSHNIRLYNAPWIMMLFSEMYFLTKDTYYTDQIVKIVRKYYANGGSKFYPNGLSFTKVMAALRDSDNSDAEEMFELFLKHAENIIEIGPSYPPHEVNYEQTIVTPAVTLISHIGILTGDERYALEAKKHIVNLERFNGHQPSFHLDEIPIRYWDDFWFGKSEMFGDTFPHYWSCLTARAYMEYYKISGEEKYKIASKKCIRNCLCLYTDDGLGSCAYVYPYSISGKKGQFYDEWANDQDYALYFAINEELDEKEKQI